MTAKVNHFVRGCPSCGIRVSKDSQCTHVTCEVVGGKMNNKQVPFPCFFLLLTAACCLFLVLRNGVLRMLPQNLSKEFGGTQGDVEQRRKTQAVGGHVVSPRVSCCRATVGHHRALRHQQTQGLPRRQTFYCPPLRVSSCCYFLPIF